MTVNATPAPLAPDETPAPLVPNEMPAPLAPDETPLAARPAAPGSRRRPVSPAQLADQPVDTLALQAAITGMQMSAQRRVRTPPAWGLYLVVTALLVMTGVLGAALFDPSLSDKAEQLAATMLPAVFGPDPRHAVKQTLADTDIQPPPAPSETPQSPPVTQSIREGAGTDSQADAAATYAMPAPAEPSPESDAPAGQDRQAANDLRDPGTAHSSTAPADRRPKAGQERGTGLLLVVQPGDTVGSLYRRVYRDARPAPPYKEVAAANPPSVKPGDILIFPAPPNGWSR